MPSPENSFNSSPSSKRSNIPDGLWNRCEVCGEITFSKELDRNFKICPKCNYHYPVSASQLIRMLIASKNFIEYKSRIHIPSTTFENPTSEFVISGETRLHGYQIVLCIIDSNQINDSNIQFEPSGTEYEKILYTFNQSLTKCLPLITFYADGTVISPKSEYTTPICESEQIESIDITNAELLVSAFTFLTNLATTVEELSQKRIPYITVLTNPCYASSEFSTSFPLGDIVLAEPKHVPRKSNNKKNSITTKNIPSLRISPENYLIDKYVDRRDLKDNLKKILSFCIS